jgi:2'-5' RNA ligase
MALRLFVAAVPDAEVVERIAKSIGDRPEGMGVRWIHPSQWHVTLQFLGAVREDRVDELRLACAYAAGRVEPFSVELAGVGAFPSVRRARVIWVAIQKGAEHLAALATAVEAETAKRGFTSEDRDFHAHLTIGRLRAATDVENLLTPMAVDPVTMDLYDIVLYRSLLSQAGARYEVVDTFPLRQ